MIGNEGGGCSNIHANGELWDIVKIAATGEKSIGVALTKNSLGELYINMDRLDDAQKYLEEAAEIRGRKSSSPTCSVVSYMITMTTSYGPEVTPHK